MSRRGKKRKKVERVSGGVTRYQFSLRGQNGGSSTNRPKNSHLFNSSLRRSLCSGALGQADFARTGKTKGDEGQRGEKEREKKRIYRLVAEMPEARRIPLNWNALLGLSDLAGFRRKWAFKCAQEPFTTGPTLTRPASSNELPSTRPPSIFPYRRVSPIHASFVKRSN